MKNIDKQLYKNIGIQLKSAREKRQISLDTLCVLIGNVKTKSTLKRYEDGISRIDVETLKAICDALGIDENEVIRKAKEPNTKSHDQNFIDELELTPKELKEVYDYALYVKSKRKE